MVTLPTIPNYELYGETETSRLPDLLHCERISERSRVHAGEILLHRHDGLLQILFADRGRITASLEGREVCPSGRFLIVVPPLAVHGFRISSDTEGWVLTLPTATVTDLMEPSPRLSNAFTAPEVYQDGHTELNFVTVGALFNRVADEFSGTQPGRYFALQSALGLLLVTLARATKTGNGTHMAVNGRKVAQLTRFRTVVEQRFRHHDTLDSYAHAVGMTPTHLNRVCRDVAGKTALQIIHDRLAIEAKRDLVYSSMTISEIAAVLGFNDPAYFSRFFGRATGQSPSAYRQETKKALSAENK